LGRCGLQSGLACTGHRPLARKAQPFGNIGAYILQSLIESRGQQGAGAVFGQGQARVRMVHGVNPLFFNALAKA
jgi:hypothetical protein